MKLKKILKLSAFTLLCTSSIMAAIGDNMNAGLGVTAGTSLQEQTWMDNYSTDGTDIVTEGPIAGVDFGTNFIVSDSASSTSILDFRNVYYPRIKTNVAGLAFNYKMKNDGGLGQGFYAAVDYTRYDDFNFWQAALGHETRIAGYGSNLNFYIPFGNTETYDWAFGSEILSTYGVDWTLSKKIESLGFGATVSYHWHDDIKDNMTAFSLGSEYTFNKNMLTTGAGYQYRDGLDSEKHGYKVYARVPLYKGIVASGMGMYGEKGLNMYKPMKRMHGGVLQAKKVNCTGLESYARYGVTSCLSSNPFDAANIKSGAQLTTGSKKANVTFDKERLYLLTDSIAYDELAIPAGTTILMLEGKTLAMGENSVIGSAVADSEYVTIASASELANTSGSIAGKPAAALTRHLRSTGAKKTALSSNTPHIIGYGKSGLFYKSSTGATTVSSTDADFSASPVGNVLHGATITDAVANDYSSTAQGTGTFTLPSGPLKNFAMGGGTNNAGVANKQIKMNKVYLAGVDASFIATQLRAKNLTHSGGALTLLGGSASVESSVFTPRADAINAVHLIGGPSTRFTGNIFNVTSSTVEEFSLIKNSGDNTNATPNAARDATKAIDMSALAFIGNNVHYGENGGTLLDLVHLNASSNAGTSAVILNNNFNHSKIKLKAGSNFTSADNIGMGNLPQGANSQWASNGTASAKTDNATGRGTVIAQGNQTTFPSNISVTTANKKAAHQNIGLGTDFAQPVITGKHMILESTDATTSHNSLAVQTDYSAGPFAAAADGTADNPFPAVTKGASSTITLPWAGILEASSVQRGETTETVADVAAVSDANITAAARTQIHETTETDAQYATLGPYSKAAGAAQIMSVSTDSLRTDTAIQSGSIRVQVQDSGYVTYMDKVNNLMFDGDSTTGDYATSEIGSYSHLKGIIKKAQPANRTYVGTAIIADRDDAAVTQHVAVAGTASTTIHHYGDVGTEIISTTKGRPTTSTEVFTQATNLVESNKIIAEMVKIEGDYFKKVITKNHEDHLKQVLEKKEENQNQNDYFQRKMEHERVMKAYLKQKKEEESIAQQEKIIKKRMK
jgi:hypothetical protein